MTYVYKGLGHLCPCERGLRQVEQARLNLHTLKDRRDFLSTKRGMTGQY